MRSCVVIPAAKVILESDHADLDGLLIDLQHLLADDDLHRTYAALDLFWARLAIHIRAEHLRLFPALLRARNSTPELDELVRLLRDDHDFFMKELGSLIKIFRSASESDAAEVLKPARPRLARIAARLEEHNKLEESRIYPLISKLGEVEAGDLGSGTEKELNNLPPRFSVG